MTTVTHTHLREIGYCNKGARAFFKRHGLDWGAFLRRGLPAEAFEKTGDAMAVKLARHAREASPSIRITSVFDGAAIADYLDNSPKAEAAIMKVIRRRGGSDG